VGVSSARRRDSGGGPPFLGVEMRRYQAGDRVSGARHKGEVGEVVWQNGTAVVVGFDDGTQTATSWRFLSYEDPKLERMAALFDATPVAEEPLSQMTDNEAERVLMMRGPRVGRGL